MAIPDFSKVWASQSPLNPYEFSDSDYLTGWNFVGAIPPDRRMFDAWQRATDTKLQWVSQNSTIAVSETEPSYPVALWFELQE